MIAKLYHCPYLLSLLCNLIIPSFFYTRLQQLLQPYYCGRPIAYIEPETEKLLNGLLLPPLAVRQLETAANIVSLVQNDAAYNKLPAAVYNILVH